MNIDKKIDAHVCPEPSFCDQATASYSIQEQENMCYKCWVNYCKRNNIEITYD